MAFSLVSKIKSKNKHIVLILIIISGITVKWLLPDQYLKFTQVYIDLLAAASSELLNLFGLKNNMMNQSITTEKDFSLLLNSMFLSLKAVIGLYMILIILFEKKKMLITITAFAIWVFFSNILRIVIVVMLGNHIKDITIFNHHAFYMLGLFLPVVILHWNSIFSKNTFTEMTVRALALKLSLVLSAYFFIIILLRIILNGGNIVDDFLSNVILYLSKEFLNFLEYDVYILGRKILNETTFMVMGDPCIGVNIMLVFAAIILVGETKIEFKTILFIMSGIATIIVLNAIRVSLLFVHVSENGFDSVVLEKQHDIYNLFVYLSIIGLWIVWSKRIASNHIEGLPI